MKNKTENILRHLKHLVSFDTQNPPRNIQPDSDIFEYLKQQLPGFEFTLTDSGNGCISLLAIQGKPDVLFNFHIDTVPVARGWQRDPFSLSIEDNKVYALGACDIKGASACMLAAVASATENENFPAHIGLLFSSDEEAGSSVAVKEFLKTNHGFSKVIISEPTLSKAVSGHRGIQTAIAKFKGIPGHASEKRALRDNAIHKATRWLAESLDWVEKQQANSHLELTGLPFNTGTINGGVKANMIAAECEIKFGFRPLPGQNSTKMLQQLSKLGADATVTPGFYGPTLPAQNQIFEDAINNANELIDECQLNKGPAVNFWTEASLFSEAGLTAIVFGPGDIAQAHTADEWVAIEQLEEVYGHYCQILNVDIGKMGEAE